MKKFLTKISFFFLALTICILCLSQIHISDEFVVEQTIGTSYEKLAWDLKKLDHPDELDNVNVFIGPSLIQGDINDSILSVNGINSVNMGINHNGFDLDHYIAKRVLEKSKPGKIYLYRPRDGGSILHPMMPLLLSPIDYAITFHQFPITFIRTYIPKRIYFAIRYLSSLATGTDKIYEPSAYGFRGEENSVIKSMKDDKTAIAGEIAKRDDFSKNGINKDGTYYSRNKVKNYWRKILYYYKGTAEPIRARTVELVKNAGVPVSEIYLPSYLDALIDDKTDNRTFFRKPIPYDYNCLTLESYAFLNDSNLWFDHHHLNTNGTAVFTDSLIVHLPPL